MVNLGDARRKERNAVFSGGLTFMPLRMRVWNHVMVYIVFLYHSQVSAITYLVLRKTCFLLSIENLMCSRFNMFNLMFKGLACTCLLLLSKDRRWLISTI